MAYVNLDTGAALYKDCFDYYGRSIKKFWQSEPLNALYFDEKEE
jgi:hypothetical protein